MITSIYIDLDGVLVDWHTAACRLFGVDPADIEDKSEHDICGHLGIDEDTLWDRIDQEGEDFWADLDSYGWADQLWKGCCRIAPTCLLTSPSRAYFSSAGKHKWVREHLGNTRDFIFTSNKHLLARPGRVLIDDYRKNIQLWRQAGGIGMLFRQPWSTEGLLVGQVIDTLLFLRESTRIDRYDENGKVLDPTVRARIVPLGA